MQETWLVRFGARESTRFERALPRTHHDGLTNVQAFLDGRLLSATGPERAEVRLGRKPQVRWTVAPIRDDVRTFQVRFRATAALAITGRRARLAWPLLEPRHGWAIGEARIVLTAPAGGVLAEPAGLGETGWAVTERPDGIGAAKTSVTSGESITPMLELDRAGLSVSEPRWQVADDRAAEFAPAFASAGAFILVVGVAVLVMIQVLLPAARVPAGASLVEDPGQLDPAVRKLLRRGGRAGWRPQSDLLRFLVSVNLADSARVGAAEGLRTAGLVCVILGGGLFVAAQYVRDSFGGWTLAVPWSVVAVGVLFLVAGGRFTVLTPEGLAARDALRGLAAATGEPGHEPG